ncbi:MAG: hypothetical protein M1814_003474 [Vezdaea aestivalis]|nr:MAG: hypothetical protein M1814_003474 [Vezdaea aestivalis]
MSRPDSAQLSESVSSSKIYYATKLMARALKTAKSSQHRKLTRQNGEASLAELRSLDLKELAKHQIHKRLKIPSKFPASNISAQLINTKPVKSIMLEIDRLLELTDAPRKVKGKKSNPITFLKEDQVVVDCGGNLPADDLTRESQTQHISQDDLQPNETPDHANRGIVEPLRQPSQHKSQPPSKRVKTHHGDSTFLPSLGSGFYGSESDLTDDASEGPKKNRKGQIARRREWERKYGADANHLQSQDRSRVERRRRPQTTDDYQGKASKKEKVPLHPSWEAAIKAKEQKVATFQGKKVVFD